MATDAERLADTIDHSEIRRLHDAYADVVSRRQWDELRELFQPDVVLHLDLRETTMDVTGPQAIGEFIDQAVSRFHFFQFGVLGTRVHLRSGGDPDAAASRMYMTELRQTHDGHWSQIYGVYHDRFSRTDGQWWYAERTYHSLARNNIPAAIYDFPHHIQLDQL